LIFLILKSPEPRQDQVQNQVKTKSKPNQNQIKTKSKPNQNQIKTKFKIKFKGSGQECPLHMIGLHFGHLIGASDSR